MDLVTIVQLKTSHKQNHSFRYVACALPVEGRSYVLLLESNQRTSEKDLGDKFRRWIYHYNSEPFEL